MTITLRVRGLCKRFGAVVVADQIDFDVEAGTCLGVVGPNGAGKTTLFNLLDGNVAADAGSIELEGCEIGGLPRHRRARLGVGRAFQIPRPFAELTVFENVLAAACFGAGLSQAEGAQAALDVIERTGLAARCERKAGSLTLLDRKRLELAKAMAVNAKVLLLDEIAGGLTDREVHELVDIVRGLKARHAIVWIEHVAHALTATADRIMVLHFGRKLIEGDPHAVMQSPQVREVYMGIAVDAAA
ncbi:ABC transporter ATP-binding protein [Aquabacterium sp. J223]|uniref:ABC transporter ATP-binding protein n=1 Tax=Aquabacterium sp. J223 TaxID=2898431 RepID=UPI0021AD809E|nr:ABC transporter ATP-binding protein [Aquabacterium sp. J223]UUX94050.1 ABC transporter ATP-binding protein [Aquabacterium sp. J223]